MADVSLKVTAHLASPLAGEPPNLDALLHLSMVGQTTKGRAESSAMAAGQRDPDETSPIPLASRQCGDWLVYRCSSPILSATEATSIERLSKAISASDALLLAPEKRKVIMPTKGWAKRYWCARSVRTIDRVSWFVEGDRDLIAKALESAPGIGMDANCGYGRVGRWEIEDSCLPSDSCWFVESGEEKILMRPLPTNHGDWKLPKGLVGFRRSYGAVRFPYWYPAYQTAIVTPC